MMFDKPHPSLKRPYSVQPLAIDTRGEASHEASTSCANLSCSFCQDPYGFLDNFPNDYCGRFDLPHQAGTLASEKIHGVDVSRGIPCRRNSAKAWQKYTSTERNLSYDGFVRALF